MNAVIINGRQYNFGSSGPRNALIDTGVPLILIPLMDLTQIRDSLPGVSIHPIGGSDDIFTLIARCTAQTDLSLTFGGVSYRIDPRDLRGQSLGNNWCIIKFYGMKNRG